MNQAQLADSVSKALQTYFDDLDGERAGGIYDMVRRCVEKPMLEVVLAQARGNQTLADQMLGVNRNTLRKKMKEYGLL